MIWSCVYLVDRHAAKLYPQKRCFGTPVSSSGGSQSLTSSSNDKKSSSWITFRLAERRASDIAVVMSSVLRLKPGQAIGILAANCAEWQLVHLAASSRRLVVVPLYTTLSVSAAAEIVDHAEIVALFVGARQLATASAVASQCSTLHRTVVTTNFISDYLAFWTHSATQHSATANFWRSAISLSSYVLDNNLHLVK